MWPNLPPKAITELQSRNIGRQPCGCFVNVPLLTARVGLWVCDKQSVEHVVLYCDSGSAELPGLPHTLMTAAVSWTFF